MGALFTLCLLNFFDNDGRFAQERGDRADSDQHRGQRRADNSQRKWKFDKNAACFVLDDNPPDVSLADQLFHRH